MRLNFTLEAINGTFPEYIKDAENAASYADGLKSGKDLGEYMSLTERIKGSAVLYTPPYFERGIRYLKDTEKLSISLPLPASREEIKKYFTIISEVLGESDEETHKMGKAEGFDCKFKRLNQAEKETFIEKKTEEGLKKSHEAFKLLKNTREEYVEIMMTRWSYYAHKNDYEMLFESEEGFLNIIRALQHDPKLYYMTPTFKDNMAYYVTTEKIKTLAPSSIGNIEGDEGELKAQFVFNVPGKGMAQMEYNEFIKRLNPDEYTPYDLFRILLPEMSLESVLEVMDREII